MRNQEKINLKAEERAYLEQFCRKGVHNVRAVNRAKIILCLDTTEGRKAQKARGDSSDSRSKPSDSEQREERFSKSQ